MLRLRCAPFRMTRPNLMPPRRALTLTLSLRRGGRWPPPFALLRDLAVALDSSLRWDDVG